LRFFSGALQSILEKKTARKLKCGSGMETGEHNHPVCKKIERRPVLYDERG
jgi:hypothetical protein